MSQWFWPSLQRELRASWTRLSLSAISLFLATSALTSIILTDARLAHQTRKQADVVLGGDAEIYDVRLIPETLIEKLQSSAYIARKTRITNFITMMNPTPGQRPRLVEAVSIDDSWPLVPGVKLTPSSSYEQLRSGGIWIEKTLASNLGLQVQKVSPGDELNEKSLQKLWTERKAVRIGKKTYPVVGLVENDQMRDFASFAVGARIYMARDIAVKQRYVSNQSRLRDKFILQFASGVSAESGKKWLSKEIENLGNSKPNLRSKEDALASAFKPARSLFLFYDAVGFSILILLGLGCAQGIHSYLSRKHGDAQIFTMLGAPRTQTAALYVGNVLVVAIVSLALGAWAGYIAFEKFLVPRLMLWTPGLSLDFAQSELLSLSLRFAVGVLILTAALVLPGAMLFLRRKNIRRDNNKIELPGLLTSIKTLASKAIANLENFPDLVWLFAAFLLSFLISQETLLNLFLVLFLTLIYLLVRVTVRSLARFGLSSRFKIPLFIRIATSEIASRPTQSALSLMLFTLSVCLVVFLWDLRSNIINQLTGGFANGTRPNIFVLDSPPESVKSVREILTTGQAEGLWSEKLTRARIEEVNGKNPDEWLAGITSKVDEPQRALRLMNREQNLTTRLEPGPDEQIVEGSFWSKESAKKNLDEVSVEAGIASLLNLQLGDLITFNVQGVLVKVKITNLRKVRWQSFRPNFLFVLHPSVLNEAPYSALVAATIRDTQARNAAMGQLFQKHPGLTSIDANEFSELAARLVNAALEIVRTLSFMLFAGALLNVCLAAWTSFTSRAKNFSLYRCLGANNTLVMSSCLTEFLVLAGFGCIIGLGASWGLSAVVEHSLLTVDDQLNSSLVPSFSVGMVVMILSTTVGAISAILILRQAPMRVLRRPN